jgi:streptogramin lyase
MLARLKNPWVRGGLLAVAAAIAFWLLAQLSESDAWQTPVLAVGVLVIGGIVLRVVGTEGVSQAAGGIVPFFLAIGIVLSGFFDWNPFDNENADEPPRVANPRPPPPSDDNGECPGGRVERLDEDETAARAKNRRGVRPVLGPKVDVDTRPTSLTVGQEGLWLAGSNGITLIKPETNRKAGAAVDVGGAAFSIALTRDRIWVSRRDGHLAEVNRQIPALERQVEYGVEGGEVAVAAGAIWVNYFNTKNRDDPKHGLLARIDPCTRRVTYKRVGREATSVEFAFDDLWVTDARADEVIRFDPAEQRVEARVSLGPDPNDIIGDDTWLWVTDYYDKRLRRIDPETNRLDPKVIRIGSEPGGVAIGADAVWTASYASGDVTRVDMETLHSTIAAVNGGNDLTDIVVGFDRLWVTPNNDSTVNSIKP